MAEEKPAEVNIQVVKQGGGGKLPWIIVIALTLVLLAGGGFFAYSKFTHHPDKKIEASEAVNEAKESKGEEQTNKDKHVSKEKNDGKKGSSEIGINFPLEHFVVNLADPDGTRYLKVNIELEIENIKVGDEIKLKMPQVKDLIITILSNKKFEDIRSTVGKYQLREEIIIKLNANMNSGKVKKAFFTEFVVQ